MEKINLINERLKSFYPDMQMKDNRINAFTSIEQELSALKDGVGIRNISDRNIIALRGKDVLEFLNRVATNKTKNMPPAGIVRTLFTNEKGRIIDRATIISLDSKYLVISNSNYDTRLKSWIDKYIITEDITTEVATGNYLMLEMFGRQTESYLTIFGGESVKQITTDRLTLMVCEDIQFFIFKQRETEKLFKYFLIASSEYSEKILEYLIERKSLFEAVFVGHEAFEIFRIKNGIPKFPNEINDDYNPHEVGLLGDVSSDKGCYIGQEVIARLETYDKVQRKLKGVVIPPETDNKNETDIFNEDGEQIGVITSAANLPGQNVKIGLAYLRKAYADEGTEVFINYQTKKTKIIVKDLPITI